MSIRKLFEQRLFTLWFGWGLPPVLAGALAIAFAESWPLGVAAADPDRAGAQGADTHCAGEPGLGSRRARVRISMLD